MPTSFRVPLMMSNAIARQKNLSSISLFLRYSSSYFISNTRQSFPSQRFSTNSLFQRHSQYLHPYHVLVSSRNISNQSKPQPEPDSHGDQDHGFFSFFPRWFKWLIGSVITFWGAHRMQFLEAEKDVAMVVEVAEEVAQAVEKVADAVEDIAKVISQDFPEGTPINQAAHVVEHVSDIIAHEAHDTKLIADKIEATEKIMETSIKDAVEAVEELIEHTYKKSNNGEKKTLNTEIYTSTSSSRDGVNVEGKESPPNHSSSKL